MLQRVLVILAVGAQIGCASAVTPEFPGDGSATDGASDARSDGANGGASDVVVTCTSGRVADGLRCPSTHDSCEIDYPCGYLACDCGGDGFWHCEQMLCDGG